MKITAVTINLGSWREKLVMAAGIAGALAESAGTYMLEKAREKVGDARKKVECFRNGHKFRYIDTDDYMGKMGKDPVYWRTCDHCGESHVGKIITKNGTLKTWLAVHTNDAYVVEEAYLPNYAQRITARG